MQNTLFEFPSSDKRVTHRIPDGSLVEIRDAFSPLLLDLWLNSLIQDLPWEQSSIRIAGRTIPIPRLQCWMGDPESIYGYSGIRLTPLAWSPLLQEIRLAVEQLAGLKFNAVLINYYRNGQDSVSWHSDDEAELGPAPVVASLSLGAARAFELRHKRRREIPKLKIRLEHGSLLIMGDTVQQHWQHQLPKDPDLEQARINLTFRRIITP